MQLQMRKAIMRTRKKRSRICEATKYRVILAALFVADVVRGSTVVCYGNIFSPT